MTKLNLKVIDMENSIVDFAKNVCAHFSLTNYNMIANPYRFREPP